MKELLEFIFQDFWHYAGFWFLIVSALALAGRAFADGRRSYNHFHYHRYDPAKADEDQATED